MQFSQVINSRSFYHVPVFAYSAGGTKFSKLEQLLAAHNWQQANAETFEILSAVCGLTIDCAVKIGNLSCYDLYILDSLWREYSHGRFGFGVQQRIWQQICAPDAIEVQDLQDERWREFCDRLGWSSKPSQPPVGYFPSQVALSGRGATHFPRVFTRLYSRLTAFQASI